jgi:hypothetical protein
MSRRAPKGLVFCVCVALSALSSPVCAQPRRDPSEALVQRGLDLRRRGQDEAAYNIFEEAWNLSHAPRARAQMGLAAQALGRWSSADRFLREALSASTDPWVTERRAVLERSLVEIDAHLGSLEVRCNVEGAEVRIDGVLMGTTPLGAPLRLPAGTVAIQLRAPGHLEVMRQAVVTLGGATREQIDMMRIGAPPVGTPPVVTPPVVTPPVVTPPVVTPPVVTPPVVTPPVVITPPVDTAPPSSASTRRALAWTAGGVAVAGVALGAVFLGLRNSSATAFNARNQNADRGDDCARGSTAQSCVDAESTVSTQGALSTVGFVVGGAAAIGSAVLFLTLPSTRAPSATGLRACGASTSGDGFAASCAIAF